MIAPAKATIQKIAVSNPSPISVELMVRVQRNRPLVNFFNTDISMSLTHEPAKYARQEPMTIRVVEDRIRW